MTIYEVIESTTGGLETRTSDHGSDCFALVELMLTMQESPSGMLGITASLSRKGAALQKPLLSTKLVHLLVPSCGQPTCQVGSDVAMPELAAFLLGAWHVGLCNA